MTGRLPNSQGSRTMSSLFRYGDDAASTTHHTLYAAGHGTLAAAQLWDLGPRSIAGRMARKAGIQVGMRD